MFQNRALTEAIAIGRQMLVGPPSLARWARLEELDRECALSLPWPVAKGAVLVLSVQGYSVTIDAESRWKLATTLAKTVANAPARP